MTKLILTLNKILSNINIKYLYLISLPSGYKSKNIFSLIVILLISISTLIFINVDLFSFNLLVQLYLLSLASLNLLFMFFNIILRVYNIFIRSILYLFNKKCNNNLDFRNIAIWYYIYNILSLIFSLFIIIKINTSFYNYNSSLSDYIIPISLIIGLISGMLYIDINYNDDNIFNDYVIKINIKYSKLSLLSQYLVLFLTLFYFTSILSLCIDNFLLKHGNLHKHLVNYMFQPEEGSTLTNPGPLEKYTSSPIEVLKYVYGRRYHRIYNHRNEMVEVLDFLRKGGVNSNQLFKEYTKHFNDSKWVIYNAFHKLEHNINSLRPEFRELAKTIIADRKSDINQLLADFNLLTQEKVGNIVIESYLTQDLYKYVTSVYNNSYYSYSRTLEYMILELKYNYKSYIKDEELLNNLYKTFTYNSKLYYSDYLLLYQDLSDYKHEVPSGNKAFDLLALQKRLFGILRREIESIVLHIKGIHQIKTLKDPNKYSAINYIVKRLNADYTNNKIKVPTNLSTITEESTDTE